jgi:RiboL-PSP-HEPN
MDGSVFTHHSRNFKPDIVEEIAKRLGISQLITRAAENPKVKTYFGVATKTAAAERLRAKLNDFYDRRNETVHSLSSTTGFAVNVILDYLELFEVTAESIRNVLTHELATW